MMWNLKGASVPMYALLYVVTVLTTGCEDSAEDVSEANVAKQNEPDWKSSYEQMLQFKRDRMIELSKISPTYPRPEHDPSLVATSYEGKIAIRNLTNGDMLVSHSGDNERMIVTFAFRLDSGELVSFYKVHLAPGYPDKIDFVPYRIFAITHNASPSPEAMVARERMSPAIFARYLASDPDFVRDESKRFLVIDAPLEPGETLL